jgi:hypothetical protein
MQHFTKVFKSFFSPFFVFILFCFVGSISLLSAQATGTYRLGDPDIKESAHGLLELKPAVGESMEFRLTYSDHGQKINVQGTAVLDAKKNFTYTKAGSGKKPCKIQFQDNGHEILLLLESTNADCGFATGVDISGTYQKISTKTDF